MIDIALEQDRLFVPGDEFSYSNTNYLIAGLVVEAFTQTAAEIVRDGE